MKVKLVVFDLDGTLANTLTDITKSVNVFLKRYGEYEATEELIRKSIGNGAKKLLERVMKALGVEGILTDDELARYKRIYLDNGTDHVELYPGVRSMLFELQRRGIKMAVATMKPSVVTRATLVRLSIEDFFSTVYSAEEMLRPKPDPWVVKICAKAMETDVSETVMVGDGMTDVRAGKDAGAVSVAILGGYGDREKLLASDADFKIDGAGVLAKVIDEVEK